MAEKSSAGGTKMMTREEENTSLVKGIYESFTKGEIPAILDSLTSDVEWIIPGSKEILYAGTYRGKEDVARFFKLLDETVAIARFEPRDYVAEGDKVVSLGYYDGKVKTTGKRFETEWAMTFTLKDGKIAKFREYMDPESLTAAFR